MGGFAIKGIRILHIELHIGWPMEKFQKKHTSFTVAIIENALILRT